jgi:hypothetical protein
VAGYLRVFVSPANSHSTKYSIPALDHQGVVQWARLGPKYEGTGSHATLGIEGKAQGHKDETTQVAGDCPWAESIGEPLHSKKNPYSEDEEARQALSGWIRASTIDCQRVVAIATRTQQKTVDVRNCLAFYLRF